MRIKNATPGLYRHCWLPMTGRDLMVIAGCLLTEHSSLPAFRLLAADWSAAWRRRRHIMRRRRVPDAELVRWFRFEMIGEPLHGETVPQPASRLLAPDAA
jgi:hypothetical protein